MSRVPFHVIIPARYASSRLPGKVLADIAGRPMVVHVAERARASGAASVAVATDDERIRQAVEGNGIRSVMTRADHPTGTDRAAEAAAALGLDDDAVVVNVQGDEPLIEPGLIRAVGALLWDSPQAVIATACHPIHAAAELFDPNVVKVVLDREGYARYFSRAPVPWARDDFARTTAALPDGLPCYRHIGIYAFRRRFLDTFARLAPSPLERFEALEQLRVLWHGFPIVVAVRQDAPVPGVDTAQDLDRVRRWFDAQARKA